MSTQVDGEDRVAGRDQAAPTSSQVRAFEASPCTSSTGVRGPAARYRAPSATSPVETDVHSGLGRAVIPGA